MPVNYVCVCPGNGRASCARPVQLCQRLVIRRPANLTTAARSLPGTTCRKDAAMHLLRLPAAPLEVAESLPP